MLTSLAMQKVEGSSPFIRFKKPRHGGGFFVQAPRTRSGAPDFASHS
jgi:hypothetical protein